MASRFQKKSGQKIPAIAGTTPSLFNFQLLTSSGVPGIDHLLGGGLPIGTVTLLANCSEGTKKIEVGESGQNYSQLIIQYFIAEGSFYAHQLFLAKNSTEVIQIPAIIKSDDTPHSDTSGSSKDEQMKIAWRYENQSPTKEEMGYSRSHHFNLNKTQSAEDLSPILSTWCYTCQLKESNAYVDLFRSILKLSEAFKINPTTPPSNILRLALLDLGSTLYSDDENEIPLLTFLFRLRALARTHFIVVLASLSPDFNVRCPLGSATHQKVTELVDISVTLTSFGKDERARGAFKEHHGILEIDKAAPLNCLQNSASFKNIKNKHLFKSLRTKFTISPMHLPPSELEEKSSSTTKAGAATKSLDF